MATIKLITTEVGKNGSAIVMGDGAVGAAGAIAIGANAGKRQPSDPAAEPEVLGEGSIDIRTAENGIYIGGRGAHTKLGDEGTDYVVFKIGGEETKLTAAQFRALLGIAGSVTAIVNGAEAGLASAPSETIAPEFSSEQTYEQGDLVYYEKELYICSSAVTSAGEWTGSANWTLAPLSTIVDNIMRILSNKVDKPAPEPAPDGTAAHPYLISSYADLEQLRQDVANGSEKRSAHYLQTADIDLGNVAWEGIGLKGSGSTPSTGHSFEGTYDGGGHAIKNLTFKHSSSSKYIGFFHAAMGATIKNLTINVNGFASVASGAEDVSGAAFVGLCSDGLTMINCTANGNMGSEARPLNGNSAGIIAYVNKTTTKEGKSTVYLENVTNNVNVYCTRKTGGIIAFLVENLTMKNVTNNGTVYKIGSGTGDGVGAMVAWSNGDTGRHTAYTLENIVNTGVVKADATSHLYGQMFGQWGMESGGNTVSGYVTLKCDSDSLPLASNWDPNIPSSPVIWFGEIRDDGLCHTVSELANNCEYIYLFKNVNNTGTAITSPKPYTLPSGYTVTIDQKFGAPNIVDSNGDPITGVRVGETDKYTYTAPAQS